MSRAAQLVAQGEAALAAARVEEAYQAFSDAYRLSPSAMMLYHLGRAARAGKRSIEAHDLYRRYLQEAGEHEEAAHREEARRVVDEPIGPSGEISVIGERGGLVFLDDRLAGALPLSMPLLVGAGSHLVRVELGKQRTEGRVEISAGGLMQMRFKLQQGIVVVTDTPTLTVMVEGAGLEAGAPERVMMVVEQVVRREQMALKGREAPGGAGAARPCFDSVACQEDLLGRSGARYALLLRITPRDRELLVEAALLDAATRMRASARERVCPAAAEQLGAALAEMLGELLYEGSTRGRGAIEVSSTPSGAEVLLDGRLVGLTPYRGPALQGTVEVTVRLAGHASHVGRVAVEDGGTARVEAALEREPAPAEIEQLAPAPSPAPPRALKRPALARRGRPLWRVVAGSAVITAGVALVGLVGVPSLVLDGGCIEEPAPPVRVCGALYDTRDLGIGMSVAGALLAAGGAVMVALPAGQRRVQAGAAFSASGPVLRLSLSF